MYAWQGPRGCTVRPKCFNPSEERIYEQKVGDVPGFRKRKAKDQN